MPLCRLTRHIRTQCTAVRDKCLAAVGFDGPFLSVVLDTFLSRLRHSASSAVFRFAASTATRLHTAMTWPLNRTHQSDDKLAGEFHYQRRQSCRGNGIRQRKIPRNFRKLRSSVSGKKCFGSLSPDWRDGQHVLSLAEQYGRYGDRRAPELLRRREWRVNHKRVARLWRRESLEIPQKQPKRRRLWFNDGSCVPLRPADRDHVWSYDVVHDRTHDGRAFRMLTLIDEYTRECLAIDVSRRMTSESVLERLSDLFVRRGVPDHIRSDSGPEFAAMRVREWLRRIGVKTLLIEPGSPWENGYIESFQRKTAR